MLLAKVQLRTNTSERSRLSGNRLNCDKLAQYISLSETAAGGIYIINNDKIKLLAF